MLEIKVPYKAGDAITVKLASSEELIARFVKEDSNTLTIEKAVILVQSGQGVGMMPWMMSGGSGEIPLNKAHVMTVLKTVDEVAKAYLEQTSSIQLA